MYLFLKIDLPLKELDLTNCSQIDDSGMVHIAQMTSLRILRLSNVKVTTAGLSLIKGNTYIYKRWFRLI